MDMLWYNPDPVGKTAVWDGHEGTVMAVVPSNADIRDYLGRDVVLSPDGERLRKPLKARVFSEAARLLVYCPHEGKWFAPRRSHVRL